jgi:four helix bundle protein
MSNRAKELQDRVLVFSVEVGRLTTRLPRSPLGLHLSRQLLRCGTSPAPNYAEAQAAESKQDFIHKMRICLKELRETQVWLLMIGRLDLRRPEEMASVTRECEELVAIFTQSVLTATKRARTPSV